MALWNLYAVILAFEILGSAKCSMVKLNNGGYEDIVIAINPGVPEDPKIIENIQNMLKEATTYLFQATKKRLFIRNVKILIPLTWSSDPNYIKPKTETYDKADAIITIPHLKYGDDPYTLQYGGCGEAGKYIHFTPNFMVDDKLLSAYGSRGRVFVHEWAHFRWGVFDEYDQENPFYITGLNVEATRCSLDITGSNRNQDTGGNCNFDVTTGLYEEGCVFLPNQKQFAMESIMYMQSLSSVTEFCDASNHNIEAPSLQNRICNSRSTWDVISNSADIKSTVPGTITNIPEPTFTLLQYKERVVTLVLDVSGSMAQNNRIGRLYQAAEVFIIQIIEYDSFVGIVQFSGSASVTSQLVQIYNDAQRTKLKALLPETANGGTHICSGILAGIEVNKKLDGSSYGTEIILLSDGEDNYDTKLCFPNILSSGVIIHTIALGPNAAKELEDIAHMTGGLTFSASDKVDANALIDAFSGISAGNGDITKEAIQLESNGLTLKPSECLSSTVFIDHTVGNSTFFLVTWQTAVPSITLEDPKGTIYTQANFVSDTVAKSSRREISGTAERGAWNYKLCNTLTANQAIGIMVSSTAADKNVPPITVTAHMNTDTNVYPNPMVIYALVSQGHLPIIGVNITAIIEPQIGSAEIVQLFDNGAGPDIALNDGVYSSYFFSFKSNGRHSLKVRVENTGNKARLSLPKNRALYVPGYIENGEIVMNPIKPSISEDDLLVDFGPFSRTASGGSFVLSNVPSGVQPDIYKPEKITDLKAKIEGNTFVLTWTATGDDLDQGTAAAYDLRMNTFPKELRDNFENCKAVNITHLKPQPSGSIETFAFVPEHITIENGTILYFSLIAIDKVSQRSDPSNIAQAALFIPPTPPPTTTPAPTTTTQTPTPSTDCKQDINITHILLIICTTAIILCLIICITACVVSCQRNSRRSASRM
ncbi:calcium-activated chloride channel regulator 1-like [Pelobates fuscus]|uniref:calcium-activated chloride channel regulator 1-like n=1 Tax=Pelobates fuscus TaxID=191477 RepID=UPI002FE474B8